MRLLFSTSTNLKRSLACSEHGTLQTHCPRKSIPYYNPSTLHREDSFYPTPWNVLTSTADLSPGNLHKYPLFVCRDKGTVTWFVTRRWSWVICLFVCVWTNKAVPHANMWCVCMSLVLVDIIRYQDELSCFYIRDVFSFYFYFLCFSLMKIFSYTRVLLIDWNKE